jgi:hypothetical protein
MKLVEKSTHRDHIHQVAGDLIHAVPQRLDALDAHLDRTTLALIKMGEDYYKSRLSLSDKALVEDTIKSTTFVRQSQARRLAKFYVQALNRSVQDMVGIKTIVHDTASKGLPGNTNKPPGEDNVLQPLPIPTDHSQKERTQNLPQPAVQKNSPAPGVTGGMTMEVDGEAPINERPRTMPEKGEEYGNPYMEQGARLHQRRPSVVALFDPNEGWTLNEEGITPEEVDFIIYGEHGVVRALCPESNEIQWTNIYTGEHSQIPLDEFFENVIFIEEDDIDLIFDFLDQEFGFEWDDSEDDWANEWDDSEDDWDDIGIDKEGGAYRVGPIRQRPVNRQRKQRGVSKWKTKRYYRKNRQKIKMRSKKRYRVVKKNPRFKRQRQIRRKNPRLFKRRLAEDTDEEIDQERDVLGVGKFDDYNNRPRTKDTRKVQKMDRRRYKSQGSRRQQVKEQKKRKPQRVQDYNAMYYQRYKSKGKAKKRAPKTAQNVEMVQRLARRYVATFYREEQSPVPTPKPSGLAKGLGS